MRGALKKVTLDRHFLNVFSLNIAVTSKAARWLDEMASLVRSSDSVSRRDCDSGPPAIRLRCIKTYNGASLNVQWSITP
jgi:hypothetical protein